MKITDYERAREVIRMLVVESAIKEQYDRVLERLGDIEPRNGDILTVTVRVDISVSDFTEELRNVGAAV
jgi:hypothetical protein